MDRIKTPPLEKGGTFGVMSPSSFVEKDDIEAGAAILRSHGYEVIVHPQAFARHNQSAGTHGEKANALHELLCNPEVKAIIAGGGGNRALHMLDMVDFELFARHPKYIAGFSDTTALLNAVYAKTGMTAIHGPVLKKLPSCRQVTQLLDLMGGREIEMPLNSAEILREGRACGPLIGGNLSVFRELVGTGFMPEAEGAVLFLEDCGDEISRIDRMFLHLRRTGILESVSALVTGDFSLQDTGRRFGFTLKDIILEHTQGLNIPVVMNAPFGHGPDLWPLPVGGAGVLDASKAATSLKFSSQPQTRCICP